MHDPTVYIIATAIIGFCFGFMACALMSARQIKRATTEGWKEAVRFYQGKQTSDS